ncbi:MAG: hypothetical protein Q8N99_08170 [Nanoarchaeota archaeon]|nr:hypothetical protein [Nanoarchaeota archaeon]
MENENAQIQDNDIRELLYKLRWETIWYSSPVTNEGTPFDGGFASRPPDRVVITFKPAIEVLEGLKKFIKPYEEDKKGATLEGLFGSIARAGLAEELLRAKQQYRGESIDDYLTSPEFFQISHDRHLLWTYDEGFERGGVLEGKEYLEKIDELVTMLLGEEFIKDMNSPKHRKRIYGDRK